MGQRLKGKRVAIIGGVSGIGSAIIDAMLSEGATVVLGDISKPQNNRSTKSEKFQYHQIDVTNENSVASYFGFIEQKFGSLDALIQNAGLLDPVLVSDATVEQWRHSFAVNADGLFFGAKYAVPLIKKAGGGSIINTSSMAAFRGGPRLVLYSASKGAALSFSYALARELASENIRVNAVCPGWVNTPFNERMINLAGGPEVFAKNVSQSVPLGRPADPKEIAPLYVYLASDDSTYVTAQAFNINGGVIS